MSVSCLSLSLTQAELPWVASRRLGFGQPDASQLWDSLTHSTSRCGDVVPGLWSLQEEAEAGIGGEGWCRA